VSVTYKLQQTGLGTIERDDNLFGTFLSPHSVSHNVDTFLFCYFFSLSASHQ
jgi:hypothetical protein